MDVYPTKNVSIGIDPYPYVHTLSTSIFIYYVFSQFMDHGKEKNYPTESYGKADHVGSVFSLALFPKGCSQRNFFPI